MPIYEYSCPECLSDFERFQRVGEYGTFCPYCAHTITTPNISLPTMRPDKHWAGTTVGDKVVYSAKEFNKLTATRVPRTRSNVEFVDKRYREVVKEKEEKKDKRRKKFFQEQLAGIEFKEPG